jgi:hypothetical protein
MLRVAQILIPLVCETFRWLLLAVRSNSAIASHVITPLANAPRLKTAGRNVQNVARPPGA